MSGDLQEIVRAFQILPTPVPIPLGTTTVTTVGSADATVVSQGQNYLVGDSITVEGGIGSQRTVLRVLAVDNRLEPNIIGRLLEVAVETEGVYSVFPTNPAAQFSTTGHGTGGAFDLLSSGQTNSVVFKIGKIGALPSPVSDTIGISICNETYDEVSRNTTDVNVLNTSGDGTGVTVRRINSMKLKKNEDKSLLNDPNTAWVGQAFNEIGSGIRDALEPSGNSQNNKCDINWTFHSRDI